MLLSPHQCCNDWIFFFGLEYVQWTRREAAQPLLTPSVTVGGMRIDSKQVSFDFGQGTTDQKLYDKVVAIRTEVYNTLLSLSS